MSDAMALHPNRQFVAPSKAAAALKRSTSTLAKWRCEGKGPRWFKLASRVYYETSAVSEYIESEYARSLADGESE